MHRDGRASIAVVALALAAAACGSAGSASSHVGMSGRSSPATVGTAQNSQLGTILVDGHGRTLYLFEKDHGSMSSCYGGCARLWPVVTTSGLPRVTGGASASLLGTTNRTDGTKQVTYHSHPLYYYVTDTQPGQITGEGLVQFGGGWDALSPQGDKIEKPGSGP